LAQKKRKTSRLAFTPLAYYLCHFIVIAHVIMSWLINFQVLNTGQPLVYQLWSGLTRLLEPIYAPIRRALPDMGGIDLAPLVVIFGIIALRIILTNNAAALM